MYLIAESPGTNRLSREHSIYNSILRDNQYGQLTDNSLILDDLLNQISIGFDDIQDYTSNKSLKKNCPQDDFIDQLVGTFKELLVKISNSSTPIRLQNSKSNRIILPNFKLQNGLSIFMKERQENQLNAGDLRNSIQKLNLMEMFHSDSSPSIKKQRPKRTSRLEKMLLGGTAEEEGNPNSNTALALGSKKEQVKKKESAYQEGILPMLSPQPTSAKGLLNKYEPEQEELRKESFKNGEEKVSRQKSPFKVIASSIGFFMQTFNLNKKVR